MYPVDRRKLALHVYSVLGSLRKAGTILQVSHSTISRWLKNPERVVYKRRFVSKVSQVIETIKSSIENDPFVSNIKLRQMILDVLKVKVSKELVRVAIKKLGMSRKKARFFSRPKDLEIKTRQFLEQRNSFVKEGRYFISIDETSFGRNMKDVKGYALVGQQLRIQRAVKRITTTSFLVAASNNTIVLKESSFGSFNSLSFSSFLESLPVPSGTVILLDNVAFHHSKVVKEVAERKGFVLLFVPPYSPWFNPIEGVFSIVKREFYRHGNIARSFDAVNSYHCSSFFKKSFETV